MKRLGLGMALAMLGALWLFAGTAQACSSPDACMSEANSYRLQSALKFQQAASQSNTADQKFTAAALYEKAFEERTAAGDGPGAQWYAALRDDAYRQGLFIRAAAQESFKEGAFLRAAADGDVNQAVALQDAADEGVTGQPADGNDQASVASNREYCKNPVNFKSAHWTSASTLFQMFVDVSRFCHRGGYEVSLVNASISGTKFSDPPGPAENGQCGEWRPRSWYHYNHRVNGVLVLGGSESGRKIYTQCRFGSEYGRVILYFHSDGSYHYGKPTWWSD
jgi:hypothetical protein